MNRNPEDAPEGCERVFLDDDTTNGIGRADLLAFLEGNEDDEVVVLDRADLGRGRAIRAMEDALQERSARLVVHATEKPAPASRGRPRRFDPAPDQCERIRTWYHSGLVMRYVLEQASKEMGWPVKPHHLKRRYGNRWST